MVTSEYSFSSLLALAESSAPIHTTSGTHRGGWSKVCRPEPGIILKYQRGYFRRHWRRPLTGILTLEQEYRALRQLRQRGFGALPEALGYFHGGRGKDRTGILLMTELSGRTTLSDYLVRPDPGMDTPAERHAVTRACGRVVAALHAAGFVHASLRAEHVLLQHRQDSGWQAELIDFEHARRTLRWLAAHRDLRTLAKSINKGKYAANLRLPEYMRFFLAYRGHRRMTTTDRVWWRVLSRSLRPHLRKY